MLGKPLWPRHIRKATVQDHLHQRIAARYDIADHPQVGREFYLVWVKTLDERDAGHFQLGAHRRVDVGVTARDTMTGSSRQQCQPTHEGAADAENMKMHSREIPGGRML